MKTFIISSFIVLASSAVQQIGQLISQTAGSDDPTNIGPIVSAGGSVTAVGGIVYIAHLLASGRLVARDPAASEQYLREANARLLQLTHEAQERENEYIDMLKTGPHVDQTRGRPRGTGR